MYLLKQIRLLDGVNYLNDPGSALLDQSGSLLELNPREVPASIPVVDGGGRSLTPGFIDAHSHSDLSSLAAPDVESKRSGGFTAEIIGNCGLSAFPVTDLNRAHLENLYRQYAVPIDWSDYPDFCRKLAQRGVKNQLFSLVGHNTLRGAAAGYDKKYLSTSELKSMEKMLSSALDCGASGLSLGLLYAPGRYAGKEELLTLLRIVAHYDRVFAIHLKSEGDFLLESLEETIELALASGIRRLHLSHLKTSGEKNWHKISPLLDRIDAVNQSGDLAITFDRYPYIESLTQLSVAGPEKYLPMTDRAIMEELKNPLVQSEWKTFLASRPPQYWRGVRLAASSLLDFTPHLGRTIQEIADLTSCDPADLTIELIRRDSVNALAAFSGMSEANMLRIISHPACLCGSDESARPIDFSIGRSHPRNFGSSARFLRLLLDSGSSPVNAIRKLTQLPVDIFQLPIPSLLTPGYQNPLLIDLKNINSCATFSSPHQPSTGIQVLGDDEEKEGKESLLTSLKTTRQN